MFDAPVILVDQDGRLLGGSYKGARFLMKPLDLAMDSLAGDALGCRNACLSGGCGKTSCCSGCVIRNTIRKTYETGEPVNHIPAELIQGTPDLFRKLNLLVSTRQAGPAIILRIEPVVGVGDEMNPLIA